MCHAKKYRNLAQPRLLVLHNSTKLYKGKPVSSNNIWQGLRPPFPLHTYLSPTWWPRHQTPLKVELLMKALQFLSILLIIATIILVFHNNQKLNI